MRLSSCSLGILVLKEVECVCILADDNLWCLHIFLFEFATIIICNFKNCGIQNGLVDSLESGWQRKQPWGYCNNLGM